MNDNSIIKDELDRASALRHNTSWLTEKFHDEQSRIVPVFHSKVLCSNSFKPKAIFLTYSQLINILDKDSQYIFMGIYNQTPYFTLDINSQNNAEKLSQQTGASFIDYNSVMLVLEKVSCELLLLARFMSYWHSRNRFCGKCGYKTFSDEAGHVLICENEACSERYYPNMDPAIIVLITSGHRCLLGRQKDWPESMYSTLAGYVEPGETLEQAVVREVSEESGVHVDNIQYKGSQSWISPNSLMLGFSACAINEDITFDADELEDVRWFTREEIITAESLLPYRNTIAYQLIADWLNRNP